MSSDDAIKATNDDATSCKSFAVKQGYWKDPHIQYFVRSPERRTPEISRGYFARVKAVRTLLDQFIKATKGNCQVVNLGAGFDTMYWNLQDEGLTTKNYIEVDFQTVTSRKCYYIKRCKPLLSKLSVEGEEIRCNNFDLHAKNFHIIGADLRDLKELDTKLAESGLDKTLPTIFLAECVLVYMEVSKSKALLNWITENFPTAFFINYEQVNMADRFGQVMVDNLKTRNCTLYGIDACKNLDTQKDRFLSQGWQTAEAMDMLAAYHILPQAEVQRIEKLEFLDERELLDQLFQHYCVCWAYKDTANIGLSDISL